MTVGSIVVEAVVDVDGDSAIRATGHIYSRKMLSNVALIIIIFP